MNKISTKNDTARKIPLEPKTRTYKGMKTTQIIKTPTPKQRIAGKPTRKQLQKNKKRGKPSPKKGCPTPDQKCPRPPQFPKKNPKKSSFPIVIKPPCSLPLRNRGGNPNPIRLPLFLTLTLTLTEKTILVKRLFKVRWALDTFISKRTGSPFL